MGNSWRMGKHWVERLVYCCLLRLGDLIAYLYVDEEKSSREGQSMTCRKEKEELLEGVCLSRPERIRAIPETSFDRRDDLEGRQRRGAQTLAGGWIRWSLVEVLTASVFSVKSEAKSSAEGKAVLGVLGHEHHTALQAPQSLWS